MKIYNKNKGLAPLPRDTRDISFHTLYGATSLTDLPKGEFYVSHPLEIKNQDINYPSDFCAAYAASEVAEDQSGVTFVPEYSFAKAKQLLNDYTGYGLNLRDIASAGCKFGFLERQYDVHHCDSNDRPARDFLADWKNWPADLDMFAWEHAAPTFLLVDGPYDNFDNFRNALWINRSESRSIVCGTLWRESFTNAKGGIIDLSTYDPNEPGGGHALKIFGQKPINGKLYLVAQLSDGPSIGDNGLFYFSREVINREFQDFGAFTFKKINKEYAQCHHAVGVAINATWYEKAMKVAQYAFSIISSKLFTS